MCVRICGVLHVLGTAAPSWQRTIRVRNIFPLGQVVFWCSILLQCPMHLSLSEVPDAHCHWRQDVSLDGVKV